MSRISFQTPYISSLSYLQRNSSDLSKVQNQLASGKKILRPSDDPAGMLQASALKSQVRRMDQFNRNMQDSRIFLENSEQVLSDSGDLIKRVRDLAIQGANDSLNTDDRRLIAKEVNELLEATVGLANEQLGDRYLFGGNETQGFSSGKRPFSVTRVNGEISAVRYQGDIESHSQQISDTEKMTTNLVGSQVFQAGPATVGSGLNTINDATVPLANFTANSTGYFRINGTQVYYETGKDSLNDIVDRINTSGAPVTASTTTDAGGNFRLQLTTRENEQLQIEDIDRVPALPNVQGLMNDLQVVDGTVATSGNVRDNYHPNATVKRNDLFQVLIDLRENLDPKDGRSNTQIRQGIESSIEQLRQSEENLLSHRATVGGRMNRLDVTQERFGNQKIHLTEVISSIEDVDLAETITELQRLQTMQQAALSSTASILRLSLGDFIR